MKGIGFILLGVLFAGCAHYQPQPLAPARTAEQLEARSLTNQEVRTFIETNLHQDFKVWPPVSWDFDLLTFAAYYYHPSLEVARAQWAVARGGETTAAQRPNPSLTATPGYDTTTSIPSPWIPLTFVDIPIETAGKRRYRRRQAAQLATAARLKVAEAAWQIRVDLRSALMVFVSAAQREALLERQLSVQEKIVDLLEGQVKEGARAASEVVPFRIALLKARLDRVDARRTAAEARVRVAEAIGVPVRALTGLRLTYGGLEDLEVIHHLSSPETRRTALQSRPDVLAALADYAATETALRLEIAKQYPDIRLQPGYQYDQGDNKWSLGIVVDLPILNHNQGPIAEARARRQESAARFDALQTKVLAELDRSTEGVRLAQENLLMLQSLGQEQAKRLDAVAGQLRAGAVDQLELLNAQFESMTAEVAQLDGRLKLQQAVGELEDAVRRPFDLPAAIYESNRAHESPSGHDNGAKQTP